MKYANAIAASTVLVWSAGCASAPKVVVQEPVGPCQRVVAEGAKDGSLQVYSARQTPPIEINTQEFFPNYDAEKGEYRYEAAHTDYAIFTEDGTRFKHVRNSRSPNDEKPALVRLPPGSYTIQAEAEESGGITMTVVVPLVVEAGQITTVHLEPTWNRIGEPMDPTRVVQLADGRIIGCRAHHLLSRSSQPTAAPGATDHWAVVP
jgi:hypothetical protein